MSRVLTNEQNYYDIANTIRQMKNVNTTYKPRQMASALKDIYSNEVEGVPPLSFEANGNNLLNYRIDGASGGVGDRTGNLFDGSWENKFIDTYGNTGYSTNRVLSSYVTVIPNQTYSVKSNMRIRAVHSFNGATHTQALIDSVAGLDGASFTVPADSNSIRISLKKANDGEFTPDDIDWFMLNAGSTALPYEPYGYKVPVVVNGKNLLQNTATTQTINGVNVIVNNDGSIKLSGTSTAITYIDINSNFNSTEFQDCYLNPFYPNNFVSSASTVLLRISNTTNRNSIQDFLNNSVIRDNGSNLRLAIRIGQNYTFSNDFVISPMISKFSDNTYESYIEPTTTNIYLDEPILENESISLSDTNKNIPTIDGTNTLTINTTIQPSNVYVQAPKDSIEATQIANELEEI